MTDDIFESSLLLTHGSNVFKHTKMLIRKLKKKDSFIRSIILKNKTYKIKLQK
jgi:hypothetical protein